jgi:hypothetical protein
MRLCREANNGIRPAFPEEFVDQVAITDVSVDESVPGMTLKRIQRF